MATHLPFPAATHISHRDSHSLRVFIYDALQANPFLQAARSNVSKAQADYRQSQRSVYNPELNLHVKTVKDLPEADELTAGLTQSIDMYGKKRARSRVGKQGLVEAEALLASKKMTLSVKLLSDLAHYRIMQKRIQLARRRTALMRQFKDQSIKKFNSGDIAQPSMDQAKLAYAEAIAQQAQAGVALDLALQKIRDLTRLSKQRFPKLPRHLPHPFYATRTQRLDWLRHLPAMVELGAEVKKANLTVRLVSRETKLDPTMNVRAGTEDRKFLIGGILSMPLMVRNDFHDEIQAANHAAIAVEQKRMNAYLHAQAELFGALSRYRLLYRATVKWHRASRRSLEAGIGLLTRLWNAGEMNTSDYLFQLKQRIDSQIEGQRLMDQTWRAWFELMEASGQLPIWLRNVK